MLYVNSAKNKKGEDMPGTGMRMIEVIKGTSFYKNAKKGNILKLAISDNQIV